MQVDPAGSDLFGLQDPGTAQGRPHQDDLRVCPLPDQRCRLQLAQFAQAQVSIETKEEKER